MAVIDIRVADGSQIDKIVFADGGESAGHCMLTNINITDNHEKVIFIETDSADFLAIRKTDVPSLIKALQKAVELGWTE